MANYLWRRRLLLSDGGALTFTALDGIAFAASRGRLRDIPEYAADDLGPLIEMVQLARSGLLPPPHPAPWLRLNGTEAVLRAAVSGAERWASPHGSGSGFARCDVLQTEPKRWIAFLLEAHKAALAAGIPAQAVSRLIGAVGEIADNVPEHTEAAQTGFVVYRSRPGSFEFAVADAGIGTLASLRSNPEYAHLADEGDALQCALTDGESRFGKAAHRGTGFSTLFRSLVNMNASLRFRSGDHVLSMQGKPVTSHASSIVQVSRWANGIVLGSTAFGADRLACDGCPPVFSRRSYLTWPSYPHKARQDESWLCVTSNVNANIRGRSRTTAHVSGGSNTSGHEGRRENFSRMRQPQLGIAPRLGCQYRQQISQAYAAVHQRLIQPLFNECGCRLAKCLSLLALPRELK